VNNTEAPPERLVAKAENIRSTRMALQQEMICVPLCVHDPDAELIVPLIRNIIYAL